MGHKHDIVWIYFVALTINETLPISIPSTLVITAYFPDIHFSFKITGTR